MTTISCSCCKLLGRPSARVNFIILTGFPYSNVRVRINWLLTHSIGDIDADNVGNLTDYQSLTNTSNDLFNRANPSLSSDSSEGSPTIKSCCCGFHSITVAVDDQSSSNCYDKMKDKMIHQLKSESKDEPPSWIIFNQTSYLEEKFLDIFLQLKSHPVKLLDYTFTVVCILGNTDEMFKDCVCHSITLHKYKSISTEYERRIKNFFTLLNSSPVLQQRTLLVEQNRRFDDRIIQEILHNLPRNISKDTSNNALFRQKMKTLFKPFEWNVIDLYHIRRNLLKDYNPIARNRLESLLKELRHTNTVQNAVYQIIRIVLVEFDYMNDEERRVYRRQLTLGFEKDDPKNLNTIAAQLVHYTHELVNKKDNTLYSLIYALVRVIYILGGHRFFCLDFFNDTPEIFTLSMSLICQRQYVLVLGGLRLCKTILNGDRVEHKYANAYLNHDKDAARKILDAIKWLLSPYQTLKIEWERQISNEGNNTIKNQETTETQCIKHARFLVSEQYIQCLAPLLYSSPDHCMHITVNDVYFLIKIINILVDNRLYRWIDNRKRFSLILVSDLCTILCPMLQHASSEVALVLKNATHLLKTIPEVIGFILHNGNDYVDPCYRFYSMLLRLILKDDTPKDITESETLMKLPIQDENELATDVNEKTYDATNVLPLDKDLILSYFNLNRKYYSPESIDQNSGNDKAKILLSNEWKKFDLLELKHDNEQLRKENNLSKDEISRLHDKFKRTQAECDRSKTEMNRLTTMIEQLTAMSTSNLQETIIQTSASSVSAGESHEENTVDQIEDIPPHAIAVERAEKFIRAISHRRSSCKNDDMRQSVRGSLQHLGSDLYTSPVHFLYELIQNAEDNIYTEKITPHLRIVINDEFILLSNNEQGLRACDVSAMCLLAVSTKGTDMHIGEKGVGFKSVFAVSTKPTIISHAWKFAFHVQASEPMSYITPIWISNDMIPEQIRHYIEKYPLETHLYLPLKFKPYTKETNQFLDQIARAIDRCILINLRRLTNFEIIDQRQNGISMLMKKLPVGKVEDPWQTNFSFEGSQFNKLTRSLIQLSDESRSDNFRVYTADINVPSTIEHRRKATKTQLILAFPCDLNYDLKYNVYTGLPVCNLGFNFLLNADFQLVTNRESVRENVRFNDFIRDHFAVFFVYLLLNDIDLRKDINHYCPSSKNDQIKHLPWWLTMVDKIDDIIRAHFAILFNFSGDKQIRRFDEDLALLISKEDLYKYANIEVIIPDDRILTNERLKTSCIKPVSIMDVLNCFPDRGDKSEKSRQEFQHWIQEKNKEWWNKLFQYIDQSMNDKLADLLLEKPIFLLQTNEQRQYLPNNYKTSLSLFITDDPSLHMWKQQLILLRYTSESERNALLNSTCVQLLTEEQLIEIIRLDHLQIANSSRHTKTNKKQIEQIWQDLIYLRSKINLVNKLDPFLVPVENSSSLAIIQNVTMPTILGVDMHSILHPSNPLVIRFPYYSTTTDDTLEWEDFFLQMNCKKPVISLPDKYDINQMPILRSFTMYKDPKLAEDIFTRHEINTQNCLRQLPIRACRNNCTEFYRVSTTFDKAIIYDLISFPHVDIPVNCRALAKMLEVFFDYDLRTCGRVLQLLVLEKNKNLELYVEWLSHLQLYVRQQVSEFDSTDLLSTCQLYLPDDQQFRSLKNLLVVQDNTEYDAAIKLVAEYLNLAIISPSINQIYWRFNTLFSKLNCTCAVTLSHLFETIYKASFDENNFYTLADCKTILKPNGVQTISNLYQCLEYLIRECVKANETKNAMLFDAIIKKKHLSAPCGSREDLQWRFNLTSNKISKQLNILIGLNQVDKKLPLLTIDRQLVLNSNSTIIYACIEQRIIEHLAKSVGKRYFILPSITETCPIVLATFNIDYIERRGKVRWVHTNNNVEHPLQDVTRIFRNKLEDPELEVMSSKYANIKLLHSDSRLLDPQDKDDEKDDVDNYLIDIDFPFWILNKIVVLCEGMSHDDITTSVIATSALATLLYKRKMIPFDQAKTIAREEIEKCNSFYSKASASVVSTDSKDYSYIDILFPTDHHKFEPNPIIIGKHPDIELKEQHETNSRKQQISIVSTVRNAEHRLYRQRIKQSNICRSLNQNISPSTTSKGSITVNQAEQILIGENAEHFFFVYLQHVYSADDITPENNWVSSTRKKVYPYSLKPVDDSLGYDFVLDDKCQRFVQGSSSQTKRCYIEVKGTKGYFNFDSTPFHISENEWNVCQTIAKDKQRSKVEAYLIVIVENCLDPEKITIIEPIIWSDNLEQISKEVNSYTCRVVRALSSKPINTQEGKRLQSDNIKWKNEIAKCTSTNEQASNTGAYVIPAHRKQEDKQVFNKDMDRKWRK